MYKTLGNRLARGFGRDTSRPIQNYVPRTRAEVRAWWYPVVRHHAVKIGELDKYGRKCPEWLRSEIKRLGVAEWLKRNERSTAKPEPKAGRAKNSK